MIGGTGVMRVRSPRSAVLYLRHNSNAPNALKIQVECDDGTCVDLYDIRVIETQRYTIDELVGAGKIDSYERWAILMMMNAVMHGLAAQKTKVIKGDGDDSRPRRCVSYPSPP